MEGCFHPIESLEAFQIPDATGECLADTLSYAGYALIWENLSPEEQTIGIVLEHSFMGDLIITLTCPNGQELLLHNQGGSNTYLGVPIDDGFSPSYEMAWGVHLVTVINQWNMG